MEPLDFEGNIFKLKHHLMGKIAYVWQSLMLINFDLSKCFCSKWSLMMSSKQSFLQVKKHFKQNFLAKYQHAATCCGQSYKASTFVEYTNVRELGKLIVAKRL